MTGMRIREKETIIVTEGAFDSNLLRVILNGTNSDNLRFEAVGGIHSALSAANTILNARPESVLLVLDNDGSSDNIETEIIRDLVGSDNPRFKLVQMIPEIETLFFVDKRSLEHALGMQIEEAIWEIGQTAPKSTLDVLIKKAHLGGKLELLSDASLLQAMRKHPKIKEIEEFAQRALA